MKFLYKLRNGQYSLPRTFWLYGFGISLLLGFIRSLLYVFFFMKPLVTRSDHILYMLYAGIMLLVSFVYACNLYPGIWKAANTYTGPAVWKYSAKILVCAWTVALVIAATRSIMNLFNIFILLK